MIQINNKQDCCGCTACESICAHNAIEMKPDAMGFLYPEVNLELCIECGLCEKVCAFQKGYDTSLNFKEPLAYAVRHKNMKEIETSRSGAMFIAISDYILNNRGVVYGAGYTNLFRVVHKRATTAEERNEFKGSKYVQSDLNDVFIRIKKDLKKNTLVLFSGTPCQTAGLNAFLGKLDKSNLFLVDIVCHGVPGPYLWKDYLTYIEERYKSQIVKVDFRDKSLGWNTHVESFIFQTGQKIIKNTYSLLFGKCIMFRPSCGNCKYTNLHRPSDMTLADFWGWEKTDLNFNKDNQGCSLVFVNTPKGQTMWNEIYDEINSISTQNSMCMQPNLKHPSVFSSESTSFYEDYRRSGFLHVAKKYGDLGWRYRTSQMRIFVRQLIKRVITIFKRK